MERLKTFTDKRGSLTLLEVGQDIPFPVERVFWIHNVPEGQERGNMPIRSCPNILWLSAVALISGQKI